jgi:hypothetical protein
MLIKKFLDFCLICHFLLLPLQPKTIIRYYDSSANKHNEHGAVAKYWCHRRQ